MDDESETDEKKHLGGVEEEEIINAEPDTLSLTPEQHERLKSLIHGSDLFNDITNAENRYLIFGRNEGELGDRRKKVQQLLDSRRSATAFRLEDFGLTEDDIDLWAPAFDVLSETATHIVGVLEDYDGGHVWEMGLLYYRQSNVRDTLWVLKRTYADDDLQRERYDNGMAASHIAALEEAIEDRVVTWRTEDDLEEDC